MEFTPQQQLDNVIRWRDELASGKHTKCEWEIYGDAGSMCAMGVSFEIPEWDKLDAGVVWGESLNFGWVIHLNDDNPGDNFAAVIEYLNEQILRRKVALVPSVAEETAFVLA
jgi:hypothetical protein